MKLRAARLRNLFLLIALFASLVALGSWDNRRNMQHVLEDGYRAVVQITGAQYQRLSPIAIEGWRPRFVEQGLTVNLKWDGKDGKPHEYRNVPVTDAFAATIVSGNQIRLAVLPAKVLDDELAVPVINADGPARFASLQEWLRGSLYIAFASWLAFVAMSIWIGQEAAGTSGAPGRRIDFPVRRLLLGIGALLVGAILTVQAWLVGDSTSGGSNGFETVAEITAAATPSSGPEAGKHVVQLSWKDARGGVHHFGPVRVSDDYWNKITQNGQLTVHQARVRAEGEGVDARPVIVEDVSKPGWQSKAVLAVGVALMLLGAGLLLSAARTVRAAK